MSNPKKTPGKPRRGWLILGIIVGVLVLGGVLARWSPVAIVLAFLVVAGLAIFVLVARPLPMLGLRSRGSGFAALGLAVLLVAGGGVAGAATRTTDAPTAAALNLVGDTVPRASATPTHTPTAAPKRTPSPTPTTFKVVTERITVPFEQTTVEDSQLDQGTTALVTAGAAGAAVVTYRLTLVNGVEVARDAVKEVVGLAPVAEVTSVGTRVPAPAPVPLVQQDNSGCHPSYTGACVPFASDVDCEGGGGNGPGYVTGPVQVIGHDEYQLDRDGDGIACD
ncbi:hypothetical protein DC31_05570 [Microbacterium sp. CH12i]|uniref:G5 domain-containing protein n=1 Tax=Microbacterium sp. CH12i TaxID=1479651 RepID=UPI000460D3AE|nr:G5 domain-containing protein [Microbacterium sp. CH12i]KDA04748.1 hypothetical protein DC31_05570 [Microbacterium sp. CH12i]